MFISKKKYNQIIEHKDKSINDSQARVLKLEQELKEAKDLKSILEKFSDGLFSINGLSFVNGSASYNLNLPDDVLRYTEDILGGKVIKQEGIKCLIIDKDGSVKTGLTKQKPDKGFTYKLLRH